MKSRGFTLLEVLIALAIVALAVGALLGSVTSSASNVIYLKDKTLAEWVALNRLTEVRIAQQMPDKGKRTGNAEMGGQKWQWEEEVIELPVKGMFRVEIRARATGENADDNKTLQKATAQKESDSKAASSDLDKLNWTSTVTGVVGTSQSARREALAAQYAGVPTTSSSSGDGKTPAPAPGTGAPDR